jgi:hypothetical protein
VVVALMVGALLAAPATPALAAGVSVSPGSISLNAGGDATVAVQVTPGDGDESARISVTGLPAGVSCASGCGQVRFIGQAPRPQLLTIKASNNAPDAGGATVTVQVVPDNSDSATATFQVSVKGRAEPSPTQPQETPTVKSVSGKVVAEANGEAVPNATVMIQDGAGHRYETRSNGSGNFSFTGSQDRPITPGRIDLGAIQGSVRNTTSFTASAGQSVTGQRIRLAVKVEVSPSPSPSASEEPLPSEEPLDDEEEAEDTTEASPGAPQNAAAEEDSGGFGNWLLILLGGLFVAIGVGTIVLLLMKRRENGDDPEDDGPRGAAAGAVPAARGGAYGGADDKTRVVNRVGAGPDPTMVGGTSLSDAPTMMHRPVVDDVPPDPYGAPDPYDAGGAQQGGWSGGGYGDETRAAGYGAAGGYGSAPASGGYGAGGYGADAPASGSGYGSGTPGGYGDSPAGGGYGGTPASGGGYGGAPASGGGYGAGGYGADAPASGGGYGDRDYGAAAGGYVGGQGGGGYGERYDEPTGRYTGEGTSAYTPPADPYPTSTYQADQAHGYGQPDAPQYGGRGDEPAGGGYGGGYGQQGGYDAGQQGGGYGGYDQRGGYGAEGYGGQQGGYGQPGGYGQEPPQQRGAYDEPTSYDRQQGGGYYDDRTQADRGRPDGPPQQDRGGRRLDWLDD